MWTEVNNKLVREFKFKDFVEAFTFMSHVANIAEELNHHPTWTNTYNHVKIELSTHDAGNKVTQKDHALAKRIDQIL